MILVCRSGIAAGYSLLILLAFDQAEQNGSSHSKAPVQHTLAVIREVRDDFGDERVEVLPEGMQARTCQ